MFYFHQPPLFLQRNLTYVIQKKCRSKKPRRRSSGKFNTLNSIADKLAEQKRGTKHYMTLTFSGFHCDELANYRHAEVQVFHKQTKIKVSKTKRIILAMNSRNANKIAYFNGFSCYFVLFSHLFVVNIRDNRHQSE